MNKTEYKKQQITEVIKMLENDFKAEFTGDDEGGRLGFTVSGFSGQFSRVSMDVCLWESISLSGHGWTPAEVLLQQEAVALEKQINEELGVLVNQ